MDFQNKSVITNFEFTYMDNDSMTFRPVTAELNIIAGFSEPELISSTANSLLFRIKNYGKYFMLKTPKLVNAMSLDILKREYEISLSLNHYNIVNAITFLPDSPVGPGILMEYVDGRNLTDFLAENPSKNARIKVAEQIISAIAHVHLSNIIHNDIKPENILVTRVNGDAKLIDFGLSDNDAFYVNKHLGGTPRYASPELLAQDSEIDSRSDIYSLGMILRDLFGNKYSSITERCMQKDKALRYRDAEELMNAWHHRDRRFHLSLVALAVLAVIGAGWAYLSVVDRRGSESLSQVEALKDSLAVSRLQSAVASRQLDSVTSILDSIGAVEKAQKELFPIVKKQIDDTVSAIKSDFRKIAKREKIRELYYVFACERLKDLWKIKDIIADSGLNADGKVTLNKYYEDCYAECSELMVDIYKNMESLYDFEREKRDFYLELCNKQEHYRPYVEQ